MYYILYFNAKGSRSFDLKRLMLEQVPWSDLCSENEKEEEIVSVGTL